MSVNLTHKYNVPAPRYTSYPTVPYWDESTFQSDLWKKEIVAQAKREESTGISLYIHLPYCEHLCTYCGCNKYITKNHAVEKPYIEAVLAEWKMYIDLLGFRPKIAEIHLGGGTPTFFDPANLVILINGLLEFADLKAEAALSFEGHPNNTSADHLNTLYGLGFKRVSFGIQDFDPLVQDMINRIQPVENVDRAVDEARKAGYSTINFDLIYGLPMQTMQGIKNTIAEVIRLKPDRISFYSYAHVPWVKGTGQRKYTEADLPEENVKRSLYEYGKQAFSAAGYTEIGMDHFALPEDELFKAWQIGELHRNFMGYTVSHSKILIGLGVSSISDCWTGYAQNIKSVAEYMKCVNTGELPVFRGHILNKEDLILRPIIHDLMCHFHTDITPYQFSPFIEESLERLHTMIEDGLVNINQGEIRVTDLGRSFIRNICMAFDARLWRNVPQTQLFSKAV